MGYRTDFFFFLPGSVEQLHEVRLWIHLQGDHETEGQGVLHAASMLCQPQVGQDHD